MLPITLTGNPLGEALSANDNGTVTGTTLGSKGPQVFCWSPTGGLENLGPGYGLFVNDQQQVYGAAPHNGMIEAAMWSNTGQPPVFLGGGMNSVITAGDIYGNVAGSVLNADHTLSAFALDNGTLTKVPGLAGRNAFVGGMNDHGVVVGAADRPLVNGQAWSWDRKGNATDLGLAGSIAALDVSNNGDAVVAMPDGMYLTNIQTPGVKGTPLGLFPTPEFLGLGNPLHASISDFGVVAGVQIENGNDYHATLSIPEAPPLPAAGITAVSTALSGASTLVPILLQSTPPGTATYQWLNYKAGLYTGVMELLTPEAGQTGLTMEQTGQLIYGLSNSLALDSLSGPGKAPDPGIVPPAQLQQIMSVDAQALKAAGWDPAVVPTF
jgi:hypothetical protein